MGTVHLGTGQMGIVCMGTVHLGTVEPCLPVAVLLVTGRGRNIEEKAVWWKHDTREFSNKSTYYFEVL